MSDPLDRVVDPLLRKQLNQIRQGFGDTISAHLLQKQVQGFQSQRGIYKPAGSEHALWVRQTLRGVYPDEEPTYHPDGSWTYRVPTGKAGLGTPT